MKKFIDTIKNIYKIEDLRSRIMITLGFILIYRIGSFIVIPGVDPAALSSLAGQADGGLAGLINIFAGGAFARASVFSLGIMPYISASIAMQLLTLAVPYFQKLQKEGESGRRTINQYTRFLTIVVTVFQSFGYIANLRSTAGEAIVLESTFLFTLSTMIVLTAGTLFVMWMGEKITDKGVGNGISILITIGIIASLPGAFVQEFSAKFASGGLIIFLVEIAVLIFIIMATILLIQGVRKIPVQYAKRNVVKGGRMMQMGGVRQYVPLKVNASGVMPIIFAQALMFLPATFSGAIGDAGQSSGLMMALSDFGGFWYNLLSFLLVVVFTYFYTALIINPQQMADELKRNGGFIPGVKPGKKTAEYLDSAMSRITLPGAIFLGIIAILPAFAMLFGVTQGFALFFGGTSLLIMVAVVLDTLQQIESYLLMRHYDGLTKSGKLKGRQGQSAVSGMQI